MTTVRTNLDKYVARHRQICERAEREFAESRATLTFASPTWSRPTRSESRSTRNLETNWQESTSLDHAVRDHAYRRARNGFRHGLLRGVLTLDGDSIKFQLPESASHLVPLLRAEKVAVNPANTEDVDSDDRLRDEAGSRHRGQTGGVFA